MNKLFFVVSLLAGWLSVSTGHAGVLSFSLDPGGTDLNSLTVGDSVVVRVVLDGLMPGEELLDLGATVTTPSDFVLTPLSIVPQEIIPGFGLLDFIPNDLSGDASGIYFNFGAGNIVSNGGFFSFELTAIGAGSGTIGIDPLSTSATFDDGTLFGTTVFPEAGSIAYSISPANNAVPEPASMVCFALLGLLPVAVRRRRNQRSSCTA